ncbi:MAG: DUF2029 domain-containing protein [Opitutae bacterium]|nr:DUF2029 domain-containing protein [Opitutae bacterium]
MRGLLTPSVTLWLAVIAGYCLLALFPLVKQRLGIFDEGMWFLDSYAVLASSDAVQAGLDPWQSNPLDVLQRQHSYSGWWFLLGTAGFTRQDNFLVGGSWVLAFGLAAFALLRPRTHGEALLAAAVMLSPPVVLAVNRANNDLVVFALLAAGLWGLRHPGFWRIAAFAAALALATGLKFYPLIAGVALLVLRPVRRGWWAAVLSLLAGGLVLASEWTDLQRAVFPVPVQVYTFGSQIIFRDLGWAGRGAQLAGAGLLGLLAVLAALRNWPVRLDDACDDLRARLAFAAGAVLLVGCFLAGISHAYRLIFVIFLAPMLLRPSASPAGRVTGGLLLAVLWLDGLYCLGTNLIVGAMPLAELLRWQLRWRFLTQPAVWAAMGLLAGSLLGLLVAGWHDWRKAEDGR